MKIKQEIDREFINDLRLDTWLKNWVFEQQESTIVPKNLTHEYLLKNFNIDNSIVKYYCLPTLNLLSETEYTEMVEGGFAGKKETALYPYSNIINGAYYSRTDLTFKLSGLTYRASKLNGSDIKYFNDLKPYFITYADGFKDGFTNFESSQITPYLIQFSDKQDFINKVFEYITKFILFSHSWTKTSGFCTNQDNEIVNAFDDGQKQGYFYRAWSFVFSNSNLFAPLFQKVFETIPPSQTEQKTIEMNPVLKPEAAKIVFDIIKDFFSPEHQTELKTILETGNNTTTKLLFKSNGNRLTDTFKKLIENDFITGCQKHDLINWIISNFTFTQQNKVKAFIYDTVEKTISRNCYPCKSPLIEIKNGQIQKVEQPRTKKYNKH